MLFARIPSYHPAFRSEYMRNLSFHLLCFSQSLVQRGETAKIDSKYRRGSAAEQVLVSTIELCWELDPNHRTDMFTVVNILRNAVQTRGEEFRI